MGCSGFVRQQEEPARGHIIDSVVRPIRIDAFVDVNRIAAR